MDKPATTNYPIMDELTARWSPRAFDVNYVISDEELGSLLEAARWSASSGNSQPWTFFVARRGTELFDRVRQTMATGNQVWTGEASALIVNVAEMETAEGKTRTHAMYDLGQAAAHLSIQASHLGLYVHQMSGFDRDALRDVLGLDARFTPWVMMAVGKFGELDQLPENLREREVEKRERKPLAEIAPGLFS